eukprot:6208887-Pleurochrysis_carterae.AAC.8
MMCQIQNNKDALKGDCDLEGRYWVVGRRSGFGELRGKEGGRNLDQADWYEVCDVQPSPPKADACKRSSVHDESPECCGGIWCILVETTLEGGDRVEMRGEACLILQAIWRNVQPCKGHSRRALKAARRPRALARFRALASCRALGLVSRAR